VAERLKWRLRWRLSVLWALEWAITGAVLTYLPLYFTENGLNIEQLGRLLAVSAVGLVVVPVAVGQVCDRWLATEKYLAISHFVGGVILVCIPIATDVHQRTGEHLTTLMVLIGLYAAAYFPTVPLATSLTFRHLPAPEVQFGKVRIWGTVGWALAGLSLSLWLGRTSAYDWLAANFPEWQSWLVNLHSAFGWMSPPESDDCFRIAALLSFALSSFCVFLPATPPARSSGKIIAPLKTLALFRDRSFALLIAVSFLLALVVPLYTLQVPKLLEQLGFARDWIPAVMVIGQISEFPALLFLPLCLRRLGLKTTFALGIAAWLIRYVFFALEDPLWLILAGIALHGVCHVFLIIVVQLFVDSRCSYDIRASAQNLFAFITMGIAMPIGFLLGGRLGQWCLDEQTGMTDYRLFFAAPAALTLVVLIAYLRWLRLEPDDRYADEAELVDSHSKSIPGESAGFASGK
jgi:MFS family permease